MCKNITIKSKLSHIIVDAKNQPTPALLKLLDATRIDHDGTLQTILAETQKKWLRPAGKERWENQIHLTTTHDNLPQLFEDLYLIQKIQPLNHHYNYAVLLGGTLNDTRSRLAYLITLWNNGIRFDSIIILVGKRPLDTTLENSESLLNSNCPLLPWKQNWQFNGQLPSTETEMTQLVFDQTDIPIAWSTIPIIFVDTPMQNTENGTLRRPNTQDTVNEWMRTYHPQGGSIVAVSHQPFIGYQDSVLRRSLPKDFTIETVGNIDSDNEPTEIILDSLARWMYNEFQILLNHSTS